MDSFIDYIVCSSLIAKCVRLTLKLKQFVVYFIIITVKNTLYTLRARWFH